MTLLLAAGLLACVFAATVCAAVSFDQFRAERVDLRQKVVVAREHRCRPRPHHFMRWARHVPADGRVRNLNHWGNMLDSTRAKPSRCIPLWPWMALASCESGRNWTYNGPSGFDGAFQFLPSTWTAAKRLVSGASVYAYAWQAPPVVQYRVARAWLAVTSWLQWPVCSAKIGAR